MIAIVILVCIGVWIVTSIGIFGFGISVGKSDILGNVVPRLEARAEDADGYRSTLRSIADVESTDDARTVARAALRQANYS